MIGKTIDEAVAGDKRDVSPQPLTQAQGRVCLMAKRAMASLPDPLEMKKKEPERAK